MSGSGECRLKGLCIKASPLGENDRLITILTDEQGIVRLAVPGARRPKSSLAAATPLTYLSLQIFGKRNLKSVRQIKIVGGIKKLTQVIDLFDKGISCVGTSNFCEIFEEVNVI